MEALFKKDFFIMKKIIFLLFISITVFNLETTSSEEFMVQILYCFLIIFSVYITILIADSKNEINKTNYIFESLPVTKFEIVSVKYIQPLLLTAVFSLYIFILNNICCTLGIISFSHFIKSGTIITSFAILVLSLGIYLPLNCKFRNNKIVGMCFYLLLFIAISKIKSYIYQINNFIKLLNNPIFMILIAFIIIVYYAASFLISISLYKNRQ